MWKPGPVKGFRAAIACLWAVFPYCASAEDIDTEHLFGFLIGADVGEVGEREFQSQTTGRFVRSGGSYRAVEQEFEIEAVPVSNFRVELGTAFSSHEIAGVPDFEDRHQLAWQGTTAEFRFKFLDRESAPFGLTLAVDGHAGRIDEVTGAAIRGYGTDLTLAFDRELIPNVVVAAFNLI